MCSKLPKLRITFTILTFFNEDHIIMEKYDANLFSKLSNLLFRLILVHEFPVELNQLCKPNLSIILKVFHEDFQ